jgi:hypothetical protein
MEQLLLVGRLDCLPDWLAGRADRSVFQMTLSERETDRLEEREREKERERERGKRSYYGGKMRRKLSRSLSTATSSYAR